MIIICNTIAPLEAGLSVCAEQFPKWTNYGYASTFEDVIWFLEEMKAKKLDYEFWALNAHGGYEYIPVSKDYRFMKPWPIGRVKLDQLIEYTQENKQQCATHDVMSSGFTLQQENAIWGVIRHLAKEQHKDPKKFWKRIDVFKMIKDELD
jgi:hypothetical protein